MGGVPHRAVRREELAAARKHEEFHRLHHPSAGKAGLDEHVNADQPGHVGGGARDVGCASTRRQAIRLPPAEKRGGISMDSLLHAGYDEAAAGEAPRAQIL